ncbi:RNA-binding protein 25 isoform X2 [Morus notabilis]|nr:RNA-binding protein 25 isoform X2 [Morus notabilis]XP_024023898.1 RNA-binding protein 25 isoform X2 [Morus notabilis]XP_024023899.1 RNA-binding protein 25 isoform X2 [Morus notabilis]XP_024023901.1 RNA-binding protein 25 isoform X2 [Morus notabilis]
MVRHAFSPRPPGAIGVLPRPPVPGIPGVRPIIPPIVRPVIPSVTPAEKPQTTVYVGKIAPTVENDFMLSVLQFCGPVKAWKRAQDPTDGTPRGFGFCEFESAEGVLRALRLLSKFSIDGQELVLNVNQATRDYLERYVEKKTENSKKLKATEASPAMKEDESAASDEKTDLPKPTAEEPTKEDSDSGNKENDNANFGIVTDEDSEADREAMGKLTSMIEERLKTKPLPPPPPPPPPPAQASGEGAGNSNSELPAKSRDGDSDADMRNDATEEKNDDESTSGNKLVSENDRTEASSPDKNRRHDRRSRDRDRERDLKREKERELERFERETERERIRKEREQRRRLEEAERQYEEYLKEWEYREREKEKQRQYEKEREKDRERKRKKEIIYEEEDDDDDSRKRWRRSALEEKRKKRLREKEDDLVDMQKEEEEIAEAKRRAEEEKQRQQEKDLLESSSDRVTNGTEKAVLAEESSAEMKDKDYEGDSGHDNRIGDMILQNGGIIDESTMASVAASDTQHSGNVTTKKLGFGLVGSGKRTAVPSVFSNEDDDDAHKEKKMRPLVPIDYSTEELQAVQTASGATQPNLVAAAEFAKRISNTGSKDEKLDAEKERSRRTKDRYDEDGNRTRNETKEKTRDTTDREYGGDRVKTTNNKKLLDAKQLIDMIPKTKEELFSYEINWAVYDKHALHERMRPWISKKITEFLGEEEATLVDYIVSSTQEHVEADGMLQLLQSILDEEAEMFVLKMWRMLIFEIKKVETGLSSRSRT